MRDFSVTMDTGFISIIGLLAGTCTTLSLLPQVIRTVRIRETKDISLSMYVILVTGMSLWIVYGIFIEALPVILANAVSLVLASVVLALKIRYG